MEKQLRAGEVVRYESDDHMLEAEYGRSYDRKNYFKIWLNGTYVHTSRTFVSFERKLDQLVKEYGLALTTSQ